MSNLSVTISAEAADLQAKLALAQSKVREFSGETKKVADAMRDAGAAATEEMRAGLEQAAAALAGAQAQAASYRAEIKGLGAESKSGFGAMTEAIEGISGPLDRAQGLFAKFTELFLVGLGTEKIFETVNSVAELGDQLLKASQRTGLTVGQLNALRIAADKSDISFETLTRGVLKFDDSISKAEQGTGKQRATFRALGIELSDLQKHGNDTAYMLELVAQRLNQYADSGGNKAEYVTNLFSLRMSEMGLVLKDLAEHGMAGLEEHARAVGDEFSGPMAASAARAHDAVKDLGKSFEGLKIAIADSGLIDALTAAANATSHWMHSFSTEGQIETAKKNIEEIKRQIGELKTEMATDNSVSNWLNSFRLAPLERELQEANDDLLRLISLRDKANAPAPGNGAAEGKKPDAPALPDTSGQASAMEKFRTQVAEMEADWKGAHIAMLAESVKMWEAETHAAGLTAKEVIEAQKGLAEARKQLNEAQLADDKKAADTRKAIEKNDADTDVELQKLKLTAAKNELDEELAAHKIAAAQKAAILRDLTNQEYALDLQRREQELATLDAGNADYARVYNEIRLLHAKLTAELAADDKQAAADAKKEAEQQAQAWKSAISEITSAESKFITDVLTKRQSMTKDLEQLSAQLVVKEIADDVKYYTTKLTYNALGLSSDKMTDQGGLLSHAITELTKTSQTATGTATRTALNNTSEQSWLGSLGAQLAQWLGLETSKTAATAAGDSARTASDLAASAAGRAVAVSSGFAQISIDAAVAAAGTMAAISAIPYVGPFLAPPMAAAAYAETMGFAAGMGGVALDVGAWEIPGTIGATLHAGEMVLPQTFAAGLRAALGGGGASGGGNNISANLNVTALDGKSVVALLNSPSIMRQFARNLSNYMAMNPSTRGAY